MSPLTRSSSTPSSAGGSSASTWRVAPGLAEQFDGVDAQTAWASSPSAALSDPGRRSPWSGRLRRRRDDRQVGAGAADRELLAAGGHRLAELVEQDLEAREALVEEVLGLELQPARIVVGGVDHVPRPLLGGPHDLGALHHPLGLDAGGLEHLVRLAAGLVDEVLALLEHPPRLAQLVGQARERLVEQFDDLVAVDARRRRQAASSGRWR